MRLVSCLGTTPERLAAKEHRIYVAISMGNKYFTKETVGEYIKWALDNTKDKIIVVIADRLSAYNYQAFNGWTSEHALRVAWAHGRQYRRMVHKVIDTLFYEKKITRAQRCSTQVVGIGDVTSRVGGIDYLTRDEYYPRALKATNAEFKNNPSFKEAIYAVMKANVKREMTDSQREIAAGYILAEIPLQLNMVHLGVRYDAYPYPGKITGEFLDDLVSGKIFPSLGEKLEVKSHPVALVELYT